MNCKINVDKILIYMAINKKTKDKFLKESDIGRRTLQKILLGQKDIYLSDLIKIANYMKCELTDLLIKDKVFKEI